jgi:CheY-like chemotaxis protein
MLTTHRIPVQTERATNSRPGSGPYIVVADADDDTRALYHVLFARDGYDVVEASNGRDALMKVLLQPAPTLVVTEIALPLVDGYALCEIVRHDRATADVPIMVITAEGRPAQVDRARHAGADAVLVKPATPDTILYETRWLLANCKDLRARSAGTTANVAPQIDEPADRFARSEARRRAALGTSFERFTTTTPPASPPPLTCPSCDRPLTYTRSHIGGVSEHRPEQWDYFTCQSCGTFQYHQRTQSLRLVPW